MKNKLKGIGGWLLAYVIFGLATVVYWLSIGIGLIVVSIKIYLLGIESRELAMKGAAYGLDLGPSISYNLTSIGGMFFSIFPLIIGITGLFGIYLIIKKSIWAIDTSIYFLVFNLITFIIALIASLFSGFALGIGLMILINVVIIAWLQYFRKSVRVKNTLVK